MSAVALTEVTRSGAVRAPSKSEELAPGTLVGEYEIVQKIGEGGMGLVYGARHPLIGKRAAIKVIHRQLSASAEASERFVREAQAVNQIGHPNIVDVFGFGELEDGRRFFVMEWLKGESLAARIRRSLSLDEALEILEAICKALEAAHDAGVLHRDLKPDNVFLADLRGDRPVVKLLDFGLAKLSVGTEEQLDTTRTGAVMGTPLYISPEQAKGERVEFPTDIYSLGAMAYQLFSGDVPFRASSAVETMAAHISQAPVPLSRIVPTIPPELERLVHEMLDKEPSDRPPIASVREVLAAMRAPGALIRRDSRPIAPSNALAHSDLALAATTATGPTPKTRRPRIAIIAAALLLVAAAAGGIFIAMRPGAPREPAVAAKQPSPPPARAVAAAEPPAPPPAPPPPPAPVPAGDPAPAVPESPTPVHEAKTPAKHDVHAKTGTLVVKVSGAAGARIFVDDTLVSTGAATTTQTLSPGRHVVRARSRGYSPSVTAVNVIAGHTQDVTLQLEKRHSVNAVKDPFEEE